MTKKMTNTTMLMNSIDRALMESLKVYRNGGIGSEGSFIVVNHESVDAYVVSVEEGTVTGCTCGHAHWRQQICKHQFKVSMQHGLNIAQLDKMED